MQNRVSDSCKPVSTGCQKPRGLVGKKPAASGPTPADGAVRAHRRRRWPGGRGAPRARREGRERPARAGWRQGGGGRGARGGACAQGDANQSINFKLCLRAPPPSGGRPPQSARDLGSGRSREPGAANEHWAKEQRAAPAPRAGRSAPGPRPAAPEPRLLRLPAGLLARAVCVALRHYRARGHVLPAAGLPAIPKRRGPGRLWWRAPWGAGCSRGCCGRRLVGSSRDCGAGSGRGSGRGHLGAGHVCRGGTVRGRTQLQRLLALCRGPQPLLADGECSRLPRVLLARTHGRSPRPGTSGAAG